MSEYLLLVAVLLPVLGGVFIGLTHMNKKLMMIATELIVLVTSIITVLLILNRPAESITLFRFTGELTISFRLDGVGSVFAMIVSLLWPLATLYAFEYMEHEGREKTFFMFYVITYGVTLGISLAEDLVTLYFFYEMLTLVTLPLVIHTLSKEAVRATRTYLYYSLGGAAFAFIGLIFVLVYGSTPNFTPGGVFTAEALGSKLSLFRMIYVIAFCGFSVKAAMFPFSSWLPKAGVAPTPVTALLHAVAVVKAGAFAIIRITYFVFGTELLKGTEAQTILLCLTIFTIVYGCSRAVKETHLKRRLAWSTVSNLSYILFGVAIMSPLGLMGALCHMVCHAVMKICSFFCAGAVICKSEKNYIHELDGMGRKMPKTFIIFAISGMALMGVPGLAGFVSKWYLAKAAIDSHGTLELIGVAALLISALLTAIYMMSIVVRAFFPPVDFDYSKAAKAKDPGIRMLLPLCIFVGAMFVIGLNPKLMTDMLTDVVASAFRG